MKRDYEFSTAKDALASAQGELRQAGEEVAKCRQRMADAQKAIAAAGAKRGEIDTLKVDRRRILGQGYLNGSTANTSRIDAAIKAAEVEAEAVFTVGEAADAALPELEAAHEAANRTYRQVAESLPALRHAVLVDVVRDRVAGYRAAVERLAEAHATLYGACHACDKMANPAALPPRQRITPVGTMADLTVALPTLPGLPPVITCELSAMVMAEEVKALALLEIGA